MPTAVSFLLQEALGDFVMGRHTPTFVRQRFNKMMSEEIFDTLVSKSEVEFTSRVLHKWSELKGMVPVDSRRNFSTYIEEFQYYGAVPFHVTQTDNSSFPLEVTMWVNQTGIVFSEIGSQDEIFGEFPYEKIVTWGHSLFKLIIVTGTLNMLNADHELEADEKSDTGRKGKKLVFTTDEAAEIQSLMTMYVKLRLRKGRAD